MSINFVTLRFSAPNYLLYYIKNARFSKSDFFSASAYGQTVVSHIYISFGIYTPIFSGPNRNIGVDQEHLYIDVDQYTNNNSE